MPNITAYRYKYNYNIKLIATSTIDFSLFLKWLEQSTNYNWEIYRKPVTNGYIHT